MFKLYTYRTPEKFASAFKTFYTDVNLRQVKIIASIFITIATLVRILSVPYYEKVIQMQNYAEFSLGNWTQIAGNLFFLGWGYFLLKWWPEASRMKRITVLAYVLFILLMSFWVTYTVSQNNAKNTLTVYLIGICAVSLFFSIEYLEILFLSLFMFLVFVGSMVFSPIDFDQKMLNLVAGFILSAILLSFSRYSYYYKSQHFVRLKELEEKNQEIAHLYTKQGEILGFVAHDLRNPLNNIEALGNLLLAETPQKEELKLIKHASLQAKTIINDLIEAVKADQTELEVKKIDLSVFLQRVVEKWHLNNPRHLHLHLKEGPFYALVNESKMERVLDNLISNALKFSATSQTVSVHMDRIEQQISIQIEDHGIGIPAHLIDHIFEQFTPARRTGLYGEKSIGLGLHISQQILHSHGGSIRVTSEENKGTTFTILIPTL